jgi:hypothetical protein
MSKSTKKLNQTLRKLKNKIKNILNRKHQKYTKRSTDLEEKLESQSIKTNLNKCKYFLRKIRKRDCKVNQKQR